MRRRTLLTTGLSLAVAPARAVSSTPVVAELFTSQGCSSCPPADAHLGEMSKQGRVIGLAWHVDYWNALGWHDPFARPEWTLRQRAYAMRLSDNDIYTPAMVVNGSKMVIGSDPAAVNAAVAHAAPASVSVSLRGTPAGILAEIGHAPEPLTGLLAFYDPERGTDVGAGENQGRRLMEYCIVRETRGVDVSQPQLLLPRPPMGSGMALVLQNAAWRVVGAASMPPERLGF